MATETHGVVFILSGIKFAERIAVAMYTCRQHWLGNMTLFVTDDICETVGAKICGDARIQAECVRGDRIMIKHSLYVTKTIIPAWSRYDKTVYIDGDTITVAPFGDLFEPDFAIVQFCDWHTQGRRMSGRIKAWLGISPAIDYMVNRQVAVSQPAINTGVVAWKANHPDLPQWNAVAVAVSSHNLTDEIAMQLIWPDIHGIKVFPDNYNRSPIHATKRDNTRIWHFHGDKHLKHPSGAALWWPVFFEAWKQNVAQLSQWAGSFDPWVRQKLASVGHPDNCCGG